MEKEKLVYQISIDNTDNIDIDEVSLPDEKFMEIAEKEGTVYSLDGFIRQLNSDDIDITGSWFRII